MTRDAGWASAHRKHGNTGGLKPTLLLLFSLMAALARVALGHWHESEQEERIT